MATRMWRRGWDSNPRDGFPPGGFQDRCLQPLGHPSQCPVALGKPSCNEIWSRPQGEWWSELMRRRRTELSVNRALTKPIQTLKALVLCFGGPSACEASVELECCVVFILRFGPILTGILALVLGGCSTARFGGLDEPRYSGGPRQLQSERRVEAPARSVAPVYKVERTVEPRARYSAGSRDVRDGSGYPSDTPRRTYGQQDDTSRYTPQNKGSRLSARQTQRPAQRVPVYRRHVTGRWMGRSWVGRSTATQEPFDPDRLTAAHATLPLPSYVYVTNRGNGRTVLVRVNDRPSSVVGRDRGKDVSGLAAGCGPSRFFPQGISRS